MIKKWEEMPEQLQELAKNESKVETPTDANNMSAVVLEECTLTDTELVARIDKWNGKLCRTDGRAWSSQVPPDPNNDPDLLIAELCKRFELITNN